MQGAFGGIVDAVAAFSGSEAPQDQQGRVLGRLQSAVAAGSLVGPLIGGFFVKVWGFRPLLLMMGIVTVICAIAACKLLQESHHQAQAVTPHTSVIRTLTTLLSEPKTRAFILAGICAKLSIFGLVTIFAPFVKNVVNSPTTVAAAPWVGVLQAITWSATFVGSPWWGKRNDRKAIEWNYIWASLLCGLSVILQALIQQIEWLFFLRIIQGFCFSALEQSIFLIVVKTSDERNRGVRIGTANSLLILGQIIGSFSGATLGVFLNLEWMFIVMGLVFLMSSFLVWLTVKQPVT